MTSTVMLAAMRTILDESSASFWTDAEAYAALADGQNEIIGLFLQVYKAKRKIDPDTELPQELAILLENVTNTGAVSSIVLPTGFLWLVNATWDHDGSGTLEPCYVVNHDRSFFFNEKNTFLAATPTSPKVYLVDIGGVLKIQWLPANAGTAAYYYNYIKCPEVIASAVNAELPVETHNAIVHFAVSRMFTKDQRPQESQMHYGIYAQEIKQLLGI